MTIEGEAFMIAKDIRYRRVLDEAVVVRQETNEVIVINESSASIIEFIERNKATTIACLLDYLCNEYEIDRQVLSKDIAAHIKELVAAGIIITEQ